MSQSNLSLTIHLDLKCERCVGQVVFCIESVLALFLGIHSFKLQACTISKNTQKRIDL